MKINISSFDDIDNPIYGGGGSVVVNRLANHLSSKGHIVSIITAKHSGRKQKNRFTKIYIGTNFFGAKFGQIFYTFDLLRYRNFNKPDVWIEFSTPPFTGSLLPIFTKKPLVLGIHMLAGKDMERKYKLPFEFIERLILKRYSNYICVNENDAKYIKEINKFGKISIIPNGVDLPNKLNKKNSNKNYILYLGRIEINQKGLDLLIKSFDNISTRPKPNLIIAGRGTKQEERKLKKIINRSKLKENIKFIGSVRGNRKNKLFRECKLFVSPSRFETFGITLLEAFSYTKTAVVFNLPNYTWFNDKQAIKVKRFNIIEFTKALELLFNKNAIRANYEKEAKRLAKEFSWQKTFEKYEKTILEIHKASG